MNPKRKSEKGNRRLGEEGKERFLKGKQIRSLFLGSREGRKPTYGRRGEERDPLFRRGEISGGEPIASTLSGKGRGKGERGKRWRDREGGKYHHSLKGNRLQKSKLASKEGRKLPGTREGRRKAHPKKKEEMLGRNIHDAGGECL